jgi:hypothetical protein
MLHFARIFPLLLLPAACAGPSYVAMEGVGPAGELAPQVRHALQSQDGLEGLVTISLHGVRDDLVDGVPADTVRASLFIENRSSDPIFVPVSGIRLHDDQQREVRRVEVSLPGGSSAETATLAPGAADSIQSLFQAGPPGTLRTTGSLSLEWSYVFRGQETRHRSRFLPVRWRTRVVRYHYGPYFHPWYGPAWCW